MASTTAPDLTEINTHVSVYRCGECPYLERGTWAEHQAHYESHLPAS